MDTSEEYQEFKKETGKNILKSYPIAKRTYQKYAGSWLLRTPTHWFNRVKNEASDVDFTCRWLTAMRIALGPDALNAWH